MSIILLNGCTILWLLCNLMVNSQISIDKNKEPKEIHLIYGKNPTNEINIFWSTRTKISTALVYFNAIDKQDEYFHYTTEYCAHNQSVKGFLAQSPILNNTYIQRVLLTNLIPGYLYCYEIQSDDVTSHVYSFRMPSNEFKHASSFFVLSEYGNYDQKFEESVMNNIIKNDLNSLITLYDMDFTSETYNSNVYSRLPLALPLFSPNTLEAQKSHNPISYRRNWPISSLPTSTNQNGIHFLYLNNDQIDLKWLQNDLALANNNRFDVPWIIILSQKSFYGNASFHFREKLEKIFYQYGVDLILSSSESMYERTYPVIRNGELFETSYENIDMPVHISIPKNVSKMLKKQTQNKYIAFSCSPDESLNYGRLEIINKTHLAWSYHAKNSSTIDSFMIVKSSHGLLHENSSMEKKIRDQNLYESKQRLIRFCLSLFLGTLVIVIFISMYIAIKKYSTLKNFTLNQQHQQYVNLIENELDV